MKRIRARGTPALWLCALILAATMSAQDAIADVPQDSGPDLTVLQTDADIPSAPDIGYIDIAQSVVVASGPTQFRLDVPEVASAIDIGGGMPDLRLLAQKQIATGADSHTDAALARGTPATVDGSFVTLAQLMTHDSGNYDLRPRQLE